MRSSKIVIASIVLLAASVSYGMYLPSASRTAAAQRSLQIRKQLPVTNQLPAQKRLYTSDLGEKLQGAWTLLLKQKYEQPYTSWFKKPQEEKDISPEEKSYPKITSIPSRTELEQERDAYDQELKEAEQEYNDWYRWAKREYEAEKAQNAKKWFFMPKSNLYGDFNEKCILNKIKIRELENALLLLSVFLDTRIASNREVKKMKQIRDELQTELAYLRREYNQLDPEAEKAELKLAEIADIINRLQIIDVRLLKKIQNDREKEFMKTIRPVRKKLSKQAKIKKAEIQTQEYKE